jgi:ribulose-5-phosphate 4-epimerase/fuculose-1-phosphate aldolase
VGRDLYATGLVLSNGGNMSIRRAGSVLITTHGSRLGHLDQSQLVDVAPGGAPASEPWTSVLEESAQILWLLRVLTGEA